MAVGGGLPRELFAFACLRPRDSTPVLQVLDMSNTWVASTVAPSKGLGGTDSANPLEDTSRERSLGNCRARAPVADPTEVVMGAENGAGDEEAVVQEVELSTRCCGNSVVSARLHAVWVNPADVKIFVSGRRGIGSELVGAEQRRRRRLQPMGSPGAEEGNDHGAATCHEGGETREEDRPGAAAAWRRSTVGGHGRVEVRKHTSYIPPRRFFVGFLGSVLYFSFFPISWLPRVSSGLCAFYLVGLACR